MTEHEQIEQAVTRATEDLNQEPFEQFVWVKNALNSEPTCK